MSFRIKCPSCRVKLKVRDREKLAQGFRCPGCGHRISVRAEKAPDAPAPTEDFDLDARDVHGPAAAAESNSHSERDDSSSTNVSGRTPFRFLVSGAVVAVLVLAGFGIYKFVLDPGERAEASGDAIADSTVNQAGGPETPPGAAEEAQPALGETESPRDNTKVAADTAGNSPVDDAGTHAKRVLPFFRKHCVDCHGPDAQEGELRLDTLAADFFSREPAGKWVEVLDRLNLGEMPPADEERPDAEELVAVTEWISSELLRVQSLASSTGGRVLLRRLSRTEYANTVRDLFGVSFLEGEGPMELLPPDGTLKGFNKVSKALLLDPSLMETYFTVAEFVARRAIATRPPIVPTRILRYDFEDVGGPIEYQLSSRAMWKDRNGVFLIEGGARTYDQLLHPFNRKQTPIDGEYIIRVKAGADPGQRGDPIYMDITKGATGTLARFQIDAPIAGPKVYEARRVLDSKIGGEIQVQLVNGTRVRGESDIGRHMRFEIDELLATGNQKEAFRLRALRRAEGAWDTYTRNYLHTEVLHLDKLPKLYLDYIEIEGPLNGRWPPESRRRLFERALGADRWALGEQSADGLSRDDLLTAARTIFQDLLPRAFRRDVRDEEVDGLVNLVASELEADKPFEEAFQVGVIAMLCSPDFLYIFEPADPQNASEPARPLTDFELASRLSYFLWSSMPDRKLFEAARSGRLKQPEVLSAQVDRMLADEKSEALVADFAGQWLRLHEFDRFAPDRYIFPDFYSNEFTGIGEEMKTEPLAFFREVLRQDLSVLSFLDSDWTMANERLAKWYGVDGVSGKEFQRVSFPADSPRGGLLGMAGVHKWGSDGNRTKPVERGKYILDVLFNDPPPPPPPNAGEVEPNLAGQVLTVRERLEKHRHVATCRNCHRRIDPYGLALENFNVIGQWRDQLDGEKPLAHWGNNRPPIECNGTLPNGSDYSSYAEFKTALLGQSDRFERGLAEKLFVFALGRTIEAGDRAAIDSALTRMNSEGHTLRSLVKSVAGSEAFQTK